MLMNLDIYLWDTLEQQQKPKPYGFVDFPDDFLDIFNEKRKQARSFFQTDSQAAAPQETGYSEEELKTLDKFETAKTISSLYSTAIQSKPFSEIQLKHFWKILKKIEVRKLTTGYDSNFINATKELLPVKDYAYLSLVFLLYSKPKNLGYLQALSSALKINDFLISQKDNLTDPIIKSLISVSLQLEQEQVEKLAIEKGVLGGK